MSDDSSEVDTSLNPHYVPGMAVIYWRQRMELATVCVANSISLCVLITRIFVQRKRFKRFRKAELWSAAAAVLLVFPLWLSQIMTNRYGSGLHAANVKPEWAIPFWQWSAGWMGYYLVVSMVKVSMCYSLLEILPHTFATFRKLVYLLCFVIMSLGLAEAIVWVFQCQPFLSNFDYNVPQEWCANIDAARYTWASVGITIDLALTWIPIAILKRTRLQRHERIVLRAVFCATLLGTAATAVGCYGIWLNREENAEQDLTWTEAIFIMFNSIEIMLYTVGGSLTVFSRFFISRAAQYSQGGGASTGNTPSSSFSVFSKISQRMRKLSTTSMTESRLNRPDTAPDGPYVANATAPLPPWEIETEQYELQQPLPPPATHAMAAMHDPEASKWHTWETSYGVPASRDTMIVEGTPPSIEFMGVLPDPDSPPRTRGHSVSRDHHHDPYRHHHHSRSFNDTMWIDTRNESEESVPTPPPPRSPGFSPLPGQDSNGQHHGHQH